MKTLIIYDSWHSNTATIANAVAAGCGRGVTVQKVHEETDLSAKAFDLLIIGSPTHGGTSTPLIQALLKKLSPAQLADAYVAAFDTRVGMRWVKMIGFASKRILRELEKAGGMPIAGPEGFYVEGTEGPLREGEIEHAEQWGANVYAAAKYRLEHPAKAARTA